MKMDSFYLQGFYSFLYDFTVHVQVGFNILVDWICLLDWSQSFYLHSVALLKQYTYMYYVYI